QRYVTAPAKPEQGAIFGLPGDELGAVLDWSAAAGCTTAVADLLAYFRQFAEIAAKKLLPPHLGRPDELVDVLLVQALRASGHAQLATEVEAGLWRRPDPLPAGVSHV
ncbi:MAG: hypothetical protein KJ734_05125, partial [Chloroflexi bacterium]|nr:hypothetical protein [Chloroflexota bacterium]